MASIPKVITFVLLPLLGMAFVPPTKFAPIVLRELGNVDRMVCAEYSVGVERKPNRSCVPAAMVRAWILANGRDDCPTP
jgi:hypothetical protein